VAILSEDHIVRVLQEQGLTRREAEIYLFLSKKGTQNVRFLSANLKIERVQAYRALKSLQEKGIVEATLEAPTRFTAAPFEILIDSYIKGRKAEVDKLQAQKDNLVAYWKSLSVREIDYPIPRFRILVDRNRIYEEVAHMIGETENTILELTTSTGIIQEDILGTLDHIVHTSRKNPHLQTRILTHVSKENQEIVEQLLKTIHNGKLNVEIRHIDLGTRVYPRFIIKDDDETVLYVTSRDELPSVSPIDTGLWISSPLFISALRESFMDLWRTGAQASDRIEELETGKAIVETTVIRDRQEAYDKLEKALYSAEKDIVLITSSEGVNTILRNNPFGNKQNLRVRIMAPIDLDNIDAAQKLSMTCEIRHVPISYMMMLVTDARHLFMFRTLPPDRRTTKLIFNLDNVFYTNDDRYVKRVAEMLDDIWRRGQDLEQLASGTVNKPTIQVSSIDHASVILDQMLDNNVDSVVVTENGNPVGIIGERDMLDKILRAGRDPHTTEAREIMSLPVLNTDEDQPIVEALRTMQASGIQNLAVMKKGKLVGMFSARQIR
jgi:sugar-specific transcriptional regulator TrmB/CBS domain-containing protein